MSNKTSVKKRSLLVGAAIIAVIAIIALAYFLLIAREAKKPLDGGNATIEELENGIIITLQTEFADGKELKTIKVSGLSDAGAEERLNQELYAFSTWDGFMEDAFDAQVQATELEYAIIDDFISVRATELVKWEGEEQASRNVRTQVFSLITGELAENPTEVIIAANDIDILMKNHNVIRKTFSDENGIYLHQTYARLDDGTELIFIEYTDGLQVAAYPDAAYTFDEVVEKMYVKDQSEYEEYFHTLRRNVSLSPDDELLSAENVGDTLFMVYTLPATDSNHESFELTDGWVRLEVIVDSLTYEFITNRAYHEQTDGGRRFLWGADFEYDIPFAEPEFVSSYEETENNSDLIPNQEQYHTEIYENDQAVIEYISVTGMPDENIQIKLNENLEDFSLRGIRGKESDGTYTYGSASFYVAGDRFLSVVKDFEIYNDEYPVNGSAGPASRYKSAETFDMRTGERAEDLVFGGAAYTMANAFDKFSQVYPNADDAEEKAGLHDYLQSNDFIFNYYLTEKNLVIYLPNGNGDDYTVYEAPYQQIGEMLSPSLAQAVEARGNVRSGQVYN